MWIVSRHVDYEWNEERCWGYMIRMNFEVSKMTYLRFHKCPQNPYRYGQICIEHSIYFALVSTRDEVIVPPNEMLCFTFVTFFQLWIFGPTGIPCKWRDNIFFIYSMNSIHCSFSIVSTSNSRIALVNVDGVFMICWNNQWRGRRVWINTAIWIH